MTDPTTITVPFCCQPGSKAQTFDMGTCRRSRFQVDTLLRISERDDFAYFVVLLADGQDWIMHPDFRQPCLVTWYDKHGGAHSVHIGVQRILRVTQTEGHAPVPLSHVVYTSRCHSPLC